MKHTFTLTYEADIASETFSGDIRRSTGEGQPPCMIAAIEPTPWEGVLRTFSQRVHTAIREVVQVGDDIEVIFVRMKNDRVIFRSLLAPDGIQRLISGKVLTDRDEEEADLPPVLMDPPPAARPPLPAVPPPPPPATRAPGVFTAGHLSLLESFGESVYIRVHGTWAFECPLCGRTASEGGLCRAGCNASPLLRDTLPDRLARVELAELLARYPEAPRFYFPRTWNPHATGWISRDNLVGLLTEWRRELQKEA